MPGGSNHYSNLVDITVGTDGLPTRLVIRPEAMRLAPERLADLILGTMRRAHAVALQQLLTRFDNAQIDPHLPSIRRARESAEQIQADVRRQAERVRADLDGLRRRLDELIGG